MAGPAPGGLRGGRDHFRRVGGDRVPLTPHEQGRHRSTRKRTSRRHDGSWQKWDERRTATLLSYQRPIRETSANRDVGITGSCFGTALVASPEDTNCDADFNTDDKPPRGRLDE